MVEKLVKTSTLTGLALAEKLPIGARKPEAKNNDGSPGKAPLEAQLSRTTALIRSLISGEAIDTSQSEAGVVEPVVEISDRLWSDCDHWEVAGLSREIPKLLLDVQQTLKCVEIPQLLDSWRKTPDGWIAIQPFLTDMQIWEKELPKSVIRSVASHISREGLRLVTDSGKVVGNQYDPASVRATGPRFVTEGGSDETRSRVIRDALAIGAGYVELRDRCGVIQAIASSRLVNLETAIVAPVTPVPSHFSRLDVRGRCPMCKGRRGVTTVGEALVIENKALPPDNERFLAADANAVMKGVRHNELNPFLRRLAKEGLWNPKLDSTTSI